MNDILKAFLALIVIALGGYFVIRIIKYVWAMVVAGTSLLLGAVYVLSPLIIIALLLVLIFKKK